MLFNQKRISGCLNINEKILLTSYDNYSLVFVTSDLKSYVVKSIDDNGFKLLGLFERSSQDKDFTDTLVSVISKGTPEQIEKLFSEIKKSACVKKKSSLCKILGGVGILFVLLFAIGNIPVGGNSSHVSPNDIHQEVLRHMAQVAPNTKSLPVSSSQAPLPPMPVNMATTQKEQSDMDTLYHIRDMLNTAPLNDILAEADKLSPALRDKVKAKLEKLPQNNVANTEQTGELHKNTSETSTTAPEAGKSFSINNIAGKDLLSSGGIHVPVPGGGVKDFGLQ